MKFWQFVSGSIWALIISLLALLISVVLFFGYVVLSSGKVKTKFTKKEMRYVIERSGLQNVEIESVVSGSEYYLLGGDFEERYCLQLEPNFSLPENWLNVEVFGEEERELIQIMTNMSDVASCLKTPLAQSQIKIIFADYRSDGRVNKEVGALSIYSPETGRLLYYSHKM